MSKRTKILAKLKIAFLEKQLRRNIKIMSFYAAEKRKLEHEIDEVIERNRKIESDLNNLRKEM
jgi:hypothetical protein